MSSRLVIKDAVWQLIGRIISAAFGFLTIKIITPYLGPLQYGDYSTILKYFAIWTALADLGLYVLAVKQMGAIKESDKDPQNIKLKEIYGKFVGTRVLIMSVIYVIAIVVAYLLPAYTSNPYIVWGLPFGMIFSASFMFAGVQQLPLQIFWRMDQLSRTLITARLSQLLILVPVVYFFFQKMTFDGSSLSILAFCMILLSVVASGIGQNIDIHRRAKRILPLKIKFDWGFTRNLIKRNWQYGFSYYLSSFHTLIVLMFLGWFFPTSGGHDYTGMRALSLSLIEILLIIPSSLGNSLLHKIASYPIKDKLKSIGNLLIMIYWMGALIAINFCIFPSQIIRTISGKAFLGSFAQIRGRGSDQVLPFLGIVLLMSFVKQVYNYLFVSVEKQNVLLPINLVGVAIGVPLGIWMIPRYGLLGGVVTQLAIELMFVAGAIFVGFRNKVVPIFSWKKIWILTCWLAGLAIAGGGISMRYDINIWQFFLIGAILNLIVICFSLPVIRKVARGLTVQEDLTSEPVV